MISEDYFERKEFLGYISENELKYLVTVLLKNPDFNIRSFYNDVETSLKKWEQYLQKEIPEEQEIIQKYQNLVSYTKGAEMLLLTFSLVLKGKNQLLGHDYEYIELKEKYNEIFNSSYEQYQRIYHSYVV